MNPGKLISLVVITIIVIIAAVIFWQNRAPDTTREKELLFPELNSNLNRVKIVEIKGYEENVILSHQNGVWLIQSSDNFPALSDKVRTTIIKLSELRIDSGKTKNPELYSKLAVEGPYDRQSKSRLISLLDEEGEVIASLIVGKARQGNEAIPAIYGRLPDSDQALLLQGSLEVSSNANDWFEKNIINLDSAEVQRVTVKHPGENSFVFFRKEEGQVNFNLEEIPQGKRQQSEIILNSIGTLLEGVRAESVRSLELFQMPEEIIKIEIETFRGLIIHIQLTQQGEQYFANFRFSYQAPKQSIKTQSNETEPGEEMEDQEQRPSPEEEVTLLNQHMSAWVFEIPKFKYEDMSRKLDYYIRN